MAGSSITMYGTLWRGGRAGHRRYLEPLASGLPRRSTVEAEAVAAAVV